MFKTHNPKVIEQRCCDLQVMISKFCTISELVAPLYRERPELREVVALMESREPVVSPVTPDLLAPLDLL